MPEREESGASLLDTLYRICDFTTVCLAVPLVALLMTHHFAAVQELGGPTMTCGALSFLLLFARDFIAG